MQSGEAEAREEALRLHLRTDRGPLPGDEHYVPPVIGVAGTGGFPIIFPRRPVTEECTGYDDITGVTCGLARYHAGRHVSHTGDGFIWVWV